MPKKIHVKAVEKINDQSEIHGDSSLQDDNVFCLSKLSRLPGLFLELSLRKNGNMKSFYGNKKDQATLANRERFFKKIGIPGKKVVSIKAVHGDNTAVVGKRDYGEFIDNADGLITAERDVYLSITVADCLPVIIYSPENKVVCLLHCGWQGLQKGIIEKAVLKMKDLFNISPGQLYAGIGPGIGRCHYEVGEDFRDKFLLYPDAFHKRQGKVFADLKAIARQQLRYSGINNDNIDISPVCTYCKADKYFSHRKDRLEPVTAMIAIAGMPKK